MRLRYWRLLVEPFHYPFNVYSCKAHDIDSGRTRVARRREHDNMPLSHVVAKGKVGFIPASVKTTITNNKHINENK